MKLPPNIQVRRRGNTYVICYCNDEVGGVVVTETPSGDTQLRPYVKDPVELNKDIVALARLCWASLHYGDDFRLYSAS
jgi:hypothetical protein